jgi:hypothetical protein
MEEIASGKQAITKVVLHPKVEWIGEAPVCLAASLHPAPLGQEVFTFELSQTQRGKRASYGSQFRPKLGFQSDLGLRNDR